MLALKRGSSLSNSIERFFMMLSNLFWPLFGEVWTDIADWSKPPMVLWDLTGLSTWVSISRLRSEVSL